MFYDVIGDIHGQYELLKKLLLRLGYVRSNGGWRHPDGRQAVFLGDLIDRGPEPCKVVDTVRNMMEAGSARCIMGNHEFNAIRWTMRDPEHPDSFLRQHTEKNYRQHARTLADMEKDPGRHKDYIAWFKTLPLWLEIGNARFIHACWDEDSVNELRRETQNGVARNDEFFVRASRKGTPLQAAMERICTGIEVPLPEGMTFLDKDGHQRSNVRIRWWLNGDAGKTWRELAILDEKALAGLPDAPMPSGYRQSSPQSSPVFIGHYWLAPSAPKEPLTPHVACLDYSAGRGGPLVAYRGAPGGEALEKKNFVSVFPESSEKEKP